MTAETRNENGALDPGLSCDPHVAANRSARRLAGAQSNNDAELVIETRSDACGDGVCMVYHWAATLIRAATRERRINILRLARHPR